MNETLNLIGRSYELFGTDIKASEDELIKERDIVKQYLPL